MADRLDRALAVRGLARSRTDAARLIAVGAVQVNGRVASKPSQPIDEHDELAVVDSNPFVSRAAQKLVTALTTFEVDAAGRVALDLGASTGGFTQVLLRAGASAVIALDVGHDQLDPAIRADTRVCVVEGENARYLTQERLDALTGGHASGPPRASDISLVVGDLSFISLRHVLPAMRASVPQLTDAILLVKPQFEVGRAGVRGGIVRSDELAFDAIREVLACANDEGLQVSGFASSPILGTHGNREYLLWLTPGDASWTAWEDRIRTIAVTRS